MGRPRTPTSILELRGGFKNRPSRRRDNEPKPTGDIGDPPKRLKTKDLKAAWREIVDICPPGVLTNADRLHLEIICYLLTEFRENPRDFMASKLARLEAMLGKCGLTPADRSKISGLGTRKKKNAFDDL